MGLLGCHVSIEGGVQNAPERGHKLRCEAIQIFTRNQRRWESKPLSQEAIDGFKAGIKQYQIKAVMTHSIYLINLASPDRNLRRRSEGAFLDEMDRCEQLSIPFLVFHPGSFRESSKKRGMTRLVNSLQKVLNKRPDHQVILLLENTAGAGSIMGSSFEQLGEIRDRVNMPSRLQVCLDTAHAFAAGYDLRTPEAFEETFEIFDNLIGLNALKAFHLNDSKVELGSHVDRHENIGYGHIGEMAFRLLVNDPRFSNHPMTLETPGGDEWFSRNLERLYNYRKST